MRMTSTSVRRGAIAAAWLAATAMAAASPPDRAASRQETKKEEPADQRVSGTVVDRDGTAIEQAEVSFDGPKKATVLTDAAGHFTFTGPPGDYAITVRAGERSHRFDRTIEAGELKPSGTLVIEPEALP
jgi:hypothetical protein